MKGDWEKKEFVVVLRETGLLVRVGSGEFYIRLWSIRILARLSMEASLLLFVIIQAPVVQKLDSAIQRLNNWGQVYVERERDNRR